MKNKQMQLDSSLKLGLEYFVVVAFPKTNIGSSVYNGKNVKGAAFNARKAHIKWEKKFNIDPNHDNRKDL